MAATERHIKELITQAVEVAVPTRLILLALLGAAVVVVQAAMGMAQV